MARVEIEHATRSAGAVKIAPISSRQQYLAIAWLRWRLFANGFHRKGGKGELIARLIVYPIAFGFLLLIVLGAGAAGYFSARGEHLARLDVVFLGITIFQIVVSINVSPPVLSFDPQSLIRFPVRFSSFLIIRLMLGLLSASTLVGACALLAAATGVTLAIPSVGLPAYAAALAVAVTNMLFIRMIFIWVDRWLATRRAREIFTALIFAFSIGMQYLSVTVNNFGHHNSHAVQRAKVLALEHGYRAVEGYVTYLPSGRAADAVISGQHGSTGRVLFDLGVILAYGGVCCAVFASRVRREYRGENLSEGTVSPPVTGPHQTAVKVNHAKDLNAPTAATLERMFEPARGAFGLSADVLACMSKEWIYIRRNTAQIYTTLAPLAMVLLFAGRLGSLSRSGFSYPIAVAYALLGTSALAYNSFGLDGAGIQFYFLAPVAMRSVVLAKNLFGFGVTSLQLVLVYLFLSYTHGAPPPWLALSTMLWAAMTAFANATLGNVRSFKAPRKMDPGKVQRRPGPALSGLISLALVLMMAGIGFGLFAWSAWSGIDWLPAPMLAIGATLAFALYVRGLSKVDAVALASRETMVEALTKA